MEHIFPIPNQIEKDFYSLVRECMTNFHDPSHDFSHIERVIKLATTIASKDAQISNNPERMIKVWLVSLLHDINDHKFQSSNEQKSPQNYTLILAKDLVTKYYGTQMCQQVFELTEKISWSREQALLKAGKQLEASDLGVLHIVQDADRLDAIGAIGITRVFSYGGFRARSLDESRQHFEDKLNHIFESLHTETAKKLGLQKQKIMLNFLIAYDQEVNLDWSEKNL